MEYGQIALAVFSGASALVASYLFGKAAGLRSAVAIYKHEMNRLYGKTAVTVRESVPEFIAACDPNDEHGMTPLHRKLYK